MIRAYALALLAAVLAGCTLLRPLDGLTCEPGAGNASCGYGNACEGDADCATTACTASVCQCPGDMVTIESSYCIDRTEVSNGAYRGFLATAPSVDEQDGVCSWNGDFDFDVEDGPAVCRGRRAEDAYPATCVDWCDATAYCRSLGKHLCGRIHAGANPDSGYKDPSQSEWFAACSDGGALVFPTGGFNPQACNGDSAEAAPVASQSDDEVCEGGYAGLQRMSGNVREWENSCSGGIGSGDTCLTRGGAFDSGADEDDLRCDTHDARARDDTDDTIGFRCCSG